MRTKHSCLAVLLLVASILGVTMAACAAVPAARVDQPIRATAEPKLTPTVTAGDNATVLQEIRQTLKQVQVAVSTVTQNYMLDAERAKLEAARMQQGARSWILVALVVIGLLMAAIAAPAPKDLRVKLALYIAAAIAFGAALVLAWYQFVA